MIDDPGEQELADALRAEDESLCKQAIIPSAGSIWWRATLRARLEAAQKAERPLAFAPGATAAAIAGVGAGLVGVVWQLMPSSPVYVAGLLAAAIVVVSPLVLVLALGRD
jgi:hypothetical protein